MTDDFKETRDAAIARFAEHALDMFAADRARQSVLLAVSQYWNDSADDEVHARLIASSRATPVWPHECEYDYGDETNDFATEQRPLLPGEQCWMCGDGGIDSMSFYGGYGDAMVGAFELFCRESAHQGMDPNEAYIPFAIARRDGAGVAIELVGHAQRQPATMIESAR